jgi:hypothetical protein
MAAGGKRRGRAKGGVGVEGGAEELGGEDVHGGHGVLGSPLLSLWFWVWRERGHTNPREGRSVWVRKEEESESNSVFLFNQNDFLGRG